MPPIFEMPHPMLKNTLTNWDVIHAEETRLLRAISPEIGLQQFFALMAEFEPWLQETEHLFRDKRNQAMIQLQSRLASLETKQNHE
ncbi:MAG: hypothetical protein MAG431_00387 [Chloroflexi bacterium]|nr:hypothetical protein [Chloroflexota bacterium]